LEAKVLKSSSTYEHIQGKVLWETTNALNLGGKVVPKAGNIFLFFIKGQQIKIDGRILRKDPVERTKDLRCLYERRNRFS